MWEDILKKESPFGARFRSKKPDEPFNPFKDSRGVNEAREAQRKEAKNQRKFKPKCQNDPCLRIANGTDGYGLCMPCEDDMSNNRLTDPKSPYTRKNQMKNPTLPNIYVGDKR
tara:strand:+ start:1391 stop:1729 length:339 start_codon:yes stop_codon:yes gene_type:complete